MSAVTTTKADKVAVARRIDEIAGGAMELFGQAGSFEQELAVAQAITDLRQILTPEVMQPVMALMNTDLGFVTDRDPKRAKSGSSVTPYSVDIVRECFIEARLRGFHTIGNEFNIISGRFYGTQNGFVRKVKNFPGVTEVKEVFDVPRTQQGGALIKCRATWKRDGKPDQLEREFAVKVNEFMGADAIVGKARRKLFKAIHDQLSGQVTPDGDANDEAIEVGGKVEPENILNRAAARQEEKKAETAAQTNGAGASEATAQEALEAVITGQRYDIEHLKAWYIGLGREPAWDENWKRFTDIPTDIATELVQKRIGVLRGLSLVGAAR